MLRSPKMRSNALAVVGLWLIALTVSVTSDAAVTSDLRLVDAARRQDNTAVRALLKQRADVNTSQADGATALHWSAHWDDLDTANLLIRAGANVNAANDFGVTPLSLACQNGSAAMVEALLRAGANANSAQTTGETALMTCAWSGNVRNVQLLLERGADVNAKDHSHGQTALMWAAYQKHSDVVRLLVEKGADVGARSKTGFTPLLFAARMGDLETARTLVAAGANVNDVVRSDRSSRGAMDASALLVATVRGHVDVATFLLDQGADPNADGAGYTPLHWASGSWETTITGENGIATRSDDIEWSALAGLTHPTKLELVKALLEHGANPNVRLMSAPTRVGFSRGQREGLNLEGATPFLLAAMTADLEVMRMLVAHGADPRLSTNGNRSPGSTMPPSGGTTALMVAAGYRRVVGESPVTEEAALEAVTFILELDPDIDATNEVGDTALHGAAHARMDTIVQFLVDKGAVLDAANKYGETPLTIAERTLQYFGKPLVERTHTGDLLRKLGATDTGAPPAMLVIDRLADQN